MQAERARLKRLQRLERIRAIARQAAAAESAQAEGTLAQLEALAERTRALAANYAARSEARDGAALQQAGRFAGGLQHVYTATSVDAGRARVIADGKLAQLGEAERRRAAVETHADAQFRAIARGLAVPVLGARKGFGTGLE